MTRLLDGHCTGEGYLASPRDGTLGSLVTSVGRLEQQHDVTGQRRLGVSLEYVLAARQAGLGFRWGSPWIEEVAIGPRNTIPAGQVTESLVRALQQLGLEVLCVGRSCGRRTLIQLIDIAASTGIELAAVPTPSWVRLVDEGALGGVRLSFESLLLLLDAVERGRTPRAAGTSFPGSGELLAELSRAPAADLDHAAQWVQDTQLPVTPLMMATWRTASLVNAVNAPVLDQAAAILPYHSRLASLRAPGALRMGGREAAKHLGIKTANSQDAKAISRGFDLLGSTLRILIDAGHPLIGGSGAPGIGLCPGFALREEFDHWSALSRSADKISAAFRVTDTSDREFRSDEGHRVDA